MYISTHTSHAFHLGGSILWPSSQWWIPPLRESSCGGIMSWTNCCGAMTSQCWCKEKIRCSRRSVLVGSSWAKTNGWNWFDDAWCIDYGQKSSGLGVLLQDFKNTFYKETLEWNSLRWFLTSTLYTLRGVSPQFVGGLQPQLQVG